MWLPGKRGQSQGSSRCPLQGAPGVTLTLEAELGSRQQLRYNVGRRIVSESAPNNMGPALSLHLTIYKMEMLVGG